MIRKSMLVLLAVVLAAPALALAQDEVLVQAGNGKVEAARLIELEVEVVSVDVPNRKITLRHDDGFVETIGVTDDVKRLDEVKPGDDIAIQVYRSLALQLVKQPGAQPSASDVSAEMRAEPAELPGGIRTRQMTISAKVTALDAAAKTVTLVGPKGNSAELAVEPDVFAKLKIGDVVEAVYTEAMAISVSRVQVQ